MKYFCSVLVSTTVVSDCVCQVSKKYKKWRERMVV